MKYVEKKIARSSLSPWPTILRQGLLLSAALLAVGFVLPGVSVGLAGSVSQTGSKQGLQSEDSQAQEEQTAALWDSTQTLSVLMDGQVEIMTLDQYLWGVVAAEMPAAFETEALKAQAVAARSETLYRQAHPTSQHQQAAVCTDSTCCQAYLTVQEAAEKWDTLTDRYTEKLRQAVTDTDGVVVTYQGEVIQAVFHSSSDGHTLGAEEVWGSDLPYLQPVSSPEGEEVPNYYSVVTVPADTFRQTILAEAPSAQLGDDPTAWDITLERTEAGDPATLTVGGAVLSATQVRTLFDLRSARFSLEVDDTGVTFYVTGYGHGVGMSQYGANALAKEGKTYREILQWYYTDVDVETASAAG